MWVICNPDGLYISSNYSKDISWLETPFLFHTERQLKAYLGRVKGYTSRTPGGIGVWVRDPFDPRRWKSSQTKDPFKGCVVQQIEFNAVSTTKL